MSAKRQRVAGKKGLFKAVGITAEENLGRRGVQGAETPDWLYAALQQRYGQFDFDPCPHEPDFDGLVVPWRCLNYVNPPYKEIPRWLDKALVERERGRASVFLIPFRPQRKYFVEKILPNATEIRLLRRLVRFKGFEKPLPVFLCAVLLGRAKAPLRQDGAEISNPLYIWSLPKGQPTYATVQRELEAVRGAAYATVATGAAPSGLFSGPTLLCDVPKKQFAAAAQQSDSATDLLALFSPTVDSLLKYVFLERAVKAVAILVPNLHRRGAQGELYRSIYPSFVAFGGPLPPDALRDATPFRVFIWDLDQTDPQVLN